MRVQVTKHPSYLNGVRQAYPHIERGQPFNSRSVVAGNLIFLSMASARSTATGLVQATKMNEQVFSALDNVRAAMEEAGSSMNNVIKDTVLVGKAEDVGPARAAMFAYYQEHAPLLLEEPPTTSFVVTQLEDAEYLRPR